MDEHSGENKAGGGNTVYNKIMKERTKRGMTGKTRGVDGQKRQATVSLKTPE